jgi:hypothetical protein
MRAGSRFLIGQVLCLSVLFALATPVVVAQGKGAARQATELPTETIVLSAQGESLRAMVIRLMADAGDLEVVLRRNRIASATNILPLDTPIRFTVARMRMEAASARVLVSGMNAKWLPLTGASRQLLTSSSPGQGDAVETPEAASALLELPDGSRVQVPPKSKLILERLQRVAGTQIYLIALHVESGRLEADVNKRRNAASQFNVRTRYAVTGVRGTQFRVADLDGSGSAEVATGKVAVRSLSSGAAADPDAVAAGYGALVKDGEPKPTVKQLLPAPLLPIVPVIEQQAEVISFEPVDGSRRYRSQFLRQTAQGAEIVLEEVQSRPQASFKGLADGPYRLVVRAIDPDGLEGLELNVPIELNSAMVTPRLVVPGKR